MRSDTELFPKLPSWPLAMAINRLILRERSGLNVLAVVADDTPDETRNMVCARLGISSRSLYAWEHGEREQVRFDTVDRILQRGGWLWFDVFERCPGDARHYRDVSAHGECARCEAYCAAEDAFTSEALAEDRPGAQQSLDVAPSAPTPDLIGEYIELRQQRARRNGRRDGQPRGQGQQLDMAA